MIRNLIVVLICVVGFNLSAQKKLEKGTVKMEISDVTSSDPEAGMMAGMLKGSELNLYFNGNKNATQMSMMGGMVNQSTHTDNTTQTFDMLMDMMGQKFWISSSLTEMKTTENAQRAKDAKITYDKNDKKTILGYNCYAMTVAMPGDTKSSVKAYITEDIKSKANLIQGMESMEFAGFPLEFTVDVEVMKMTMTTKEILDTVDEAKLKLMTDGYTKMTMEEFKQKMGGLGGLGF